MPGTAPRIRAAHYSEFLPSRFLRVMGVIVPTTWTCVETLNQSDMKISIDNLLILTLKFHFKKPFWEFVWYGSFCI